MKITKEKFMGIPFPQPFVDPFLEFFKKDIQWRAMKELMNLHPDKVLLLTPRNK